MDVTGLTPTLALGSIKCPSEGSTLYLSGSTRGGHTGTIVGPSKPFRGSCLFGRVLESTPAGKHLVLLGDLRGCPHVWLAPGSSRLQGNDRYCVVGGVELFTDGQQTDPVEDLLGAVWGRCGGHVGWMRLLTRLVNTWSLETKSITYGL